MIVYSVNLLKPTSVPQSGQKFKSHEKALKAPPPIFLYQYQRGTHFLEKSFLPFKDNFLRQILLLFLFRVLSAEFGEINDF